MGNILYGISFWYTGGRQLTGPLPDTFKSIASNIAGIPNSILFALLVGIVLYMIMEHLPIGRRLYFLGANKNAANLCGISAKKYTIISFVISGVIVSIAGVILGSLLLVGQTTVGPDYLMNANAGALLGAVAFREGRVNVWGTFCGVILLATIIAGLQQLGAAYWVEPIFNGATLLLAVSLALTAEKRKATKIRVEKNKLIRESRDVKPL
jgi:Ribose/xylose/arabinose/galactoside ABC-type transport systems, permease components